MPRPLHEFTRHLDQLVNQMNKRNESPLATPTTITTMESSTMEVSK